jgi:hypothetical protein
MHTEVLGEKSVPVPLCPPQIPLQLAWEQKSGRAPILLLLGVYR